MDWRKMSSFFFSSGMVLDVGKGLELLHVELGAVKAFLDVFRISVGVGEQVLELDQAILAAFALVEHFAAVVDASVRSLRVMSSCSVLFGIQGKVLLSVFIWNNASLF